MKKAALIVLLAAGSMQLSAQAQPGNFDDQVLFTVANDTVTAGEYMAVYDKNRNVGEDIDPKTPKEYLDLYINFKLKVHQAKEMGMDTVPSFTREYNSYRDQLAKPYLTDKDVTQDLVKEAYKRMQQDVRASHIMIGIAPDAPPADTLKAYNQVMKIKKDIENGASFSKMAEKYSDDTYSAKNGGDLGYFTAFDMVYPFESAVYEHNVGDLVGPIRTQFGYHLIKVTDKRPARGTIQVAHILLLDNEQKNHDSTKSYNIKQKINEIYQELQKGADFSKLAQQYSEDPTTKDKGGILYPFGINKMYPEFEDAAFALKEPGDYTKPVRTPIGWHIIKLVKKMPVPTFEDAQAELRQKVDRDSRSQRSRFSIIKKLKKEYGYNEDPKALKIVENNVDKSYLQGKYHADSKVKGADKVLFKFADKEYTVGDFLMYLEKNQRPQKTEASLNAAIEDALDNYAQNELIAYEKAHLEQKYPEFRLLSREYYEGILLFDLTENKVWKKSVVDSTGLQDYYNANKDNYMWKERYDAYIVDAASKKLAKKAMKGLKKGMTIAEIEKDLNEGSQLNVKIDSNLYEQGTKGIFDSIEKKVGFSKIQEKNGRYIGVDIVEIKAPEVKTFDEARGMVISDYQNYLEKNWIKELKEKYPVKVNKDVLNKVIAKLDSES